MTTTAEQALTITADRYRWTDRGRETVAAAVRAVTGEEFYGIPTTSEAQVRVLLPSTTAYGQRIDASRDKLRRLGFNPENHRLLYVARDEVERVPNIGATYPDPALAHLPLYRVTGTTDAFNGAARDFHRGHLFNGVVIGGALSIIVNRNDATAANRLGFFYGLGNDSRRAAGLTPANMDDYVKYTIRRGEYEEVTPATPAATIAPTVEVTATPVEKMGKKELRAALEAEQAAHRADMEKVSARLEQEAINRDWCATYDSVVRDLSRDLTVPLRARRTRVNKRVTYNIAYDRTDTISMFDDLTPEQVETEVEAWVRRNINASAVVTNVRTG